MRAVLPFSEVDIYLRNYYRPIMDMLDKCVYDFNSLYNIFSDSGPIVYKGRTKGSFINDRLKGRMEQYFKYDDNVKVVEYRGIFGIVVAEKIFIRFNKMDDSFRTAINKKTKQTKKFMAQAELNGFPPNLMLVWGGYNPDLPWSKINGYYLVCFNNGLEWYYDMGREITSEQLSLDLLLLNSKNSVRRVTPKKKQIEERNNKSGTND